MSMTVEALAKIIHNIPLWDCYETPHAQAEALLPYIERHIAAGQQGATNPAADAIQYHNAVGPIDAMAAAFSAMDNNDTELEEWPQRAIDALAFAGWAVVPYALPYEVLGEAGISGVFETGNPKHGWDWLVAKTRIGPHGPPAATPQPAGCGACGDDCKDRGSCRLADESPKPAGAVPMPEAVRCPPCATNSAWHWRIDGVPGGAATVVNEEYARGWNAAREAAARDAWRADAVPAVKELAAHWRQEAINARAEAARLEALTGRCSEEIRLLAERSRDAALESDDRAEQLETALAASAAQPMTTQGEAVAVWLRPQDVADLSADKPWTHGASGEFNQRQTEEFSVPAYAKLTGPKP